ncbi:TolC family outer membrane protein [Vibrio japonicus]|uniref:TolC family outer membrane protein n=1 Tax=Vibrio japonicus TaxID=1824638 RepID=A0ABY5LBS6_9VIBR|nr:TolC family outer membrane protein [Vibrio japonicus]UUM29459.1 TolC family outer membrane protein [Vibrio japonicus]
MKLIKLKVLSCAVALSFPAFSQTLEQSVAYTITHSPEIKAAYNEFKTKVYESSASTGAYLPQLDLDAGIGYEDVDLASGTENELTRKEATLSLTQLIWDGSNTINDIDRTAAEAESVRYQLLSDAQDIALQVSKTYLDVIKAEEVLSLSENNLTVHEDIHSDIKRRVESGIGSTADMSQVDGRLARAKSNLIAAQNNLLDVKTQFKRLVGQAPEDLTFPRADQTALPLSVEQATQLAFQNHPVIKISQVDVDSARFQHQQSKSANLPTFSIEANQTWRDDAGGIEGSSEELSAMLRMRYNLYNGGSDANRSKSTAYQLNKAKDLRDRTFRSVEEGLNLSWSALYMTTQQKEFLANHVDSASDTVVAYRKQYRIGKRTLLDLLNTENELFEARKNYLDAKYDEQYAKYRVMNATGNLLDALRVDTPKEWNEAIEY